MDKRPCFCDEAELSGCHGVWLTKPPTVTLQPFHGSVPTPGSGQHRVACFIHNVDDSLGCYLAASPMREWRLYNEK